MLPLQGGIIPTSLLDFASWLVQELEGGNVLQFYAYYM